MSAESLDQDTIDDLEETILSGSVMFEIDLMKANPKIAAMAADQDPEWFIQVLRFVHDGKDHFAAVDGFDGGPVEPKVFTTFEQARAAADEMIEQWKSRWSD